MVKKHRQFEHETPVLPEVVRFVQAWPTMVPRTVTNISNADSYRIKVAAGLFQTFVHDPDTELFRYAENHKPFKGDEIVKHCAEGKAFTAARKHAKPGESAVSGIVLASDASQEQIQSVTKLDSKAFTCCSNACLQHINWFQREGDLRIANSMPIVSVAVDAQSREYRAAQIFSFGEQWAFSVGDVREVNGVTLEHAFEGITQDTWDIAAHLAPRRQEIATRMSEANFCRMILAEAVEETRA